MRKRFNKVLALFLLVLPFILSNCDKIDDPYEGIVQSPSSPIDTANSEFHYSDSTFTGRKILVEEFTGHQCINCPNATFRLNERIVKDYPNQIVVAAVHAGPLARSEPGTKYDAEFETEAGDLYFEKFAIGAVPKAMINRTTDNNIFSYPESAWKATIEGLINDSDYMTPSVKLNLTSAYNTQTRESYIVIDATAMRELPEATRVIVFALEGGIIDYQKTIGGSGEIPEYEHEHVLRTTFTDAQGNLLFDAGTAAGSSISNTFSITLGDTWVPENIELLAFVIDGATDEVLQAQTVHIKE